ncbi:conserved hypothetical protein [Vibrio nigripulchritudo MADA3029]|uniref:DUF1513 domain-containing protein n=1 Tax=Vibrio nigripulchritudo TaxID=28173 RepID=UPI0003B19FE4|nr:DUF1513 domain-containing protein [Vibrio nigripulchritudo]CCN50499.1 conserved hypothetical protein [Vibrio nigripulchritudo MADA3020]CCN52450.1 conserved hypothetical protein [Vibrio nigripulchritudo MADA3021]CCN62277.1 conserved hypothetical protein [Vibrio nigripulchritudo MADA3029]
MQQMVTDQTRRRLLKAALFGASAPFLPFGCASTSSQQKTPALIGCSILGWDKFFATVADINGNPIHQLTLPARGHGVAIHRAGSAAVAFGRRPGTFFQPFDFVSGAAKPIVSSGPNRHFYGHGVYSPDGRLLYATEGERGTSRGIIGVYDVQNGYQKVEEFTGFGLGPHEVIMLPTGDLAIGVGGVHTNGRTPMNLETMSPTLTYLSSAGKVLEQVSLSDNKLSIRHLAHNGQGMVFCGQQYRGSPDDYPALLAAHQMGKPMVEFKAEPEQWARFNHYIASIAATGDWVLATSPRGNCYGIWQLSTGELLEVESLPDASGVVVNDNSFKISSGVGRVVSHSLAGVEKKYSSGIHWDNHWSAII